MTQIRPDDTLFFSNIDTYLNYDTLTGTVAISGSILNGNSTTFSVNIPYTRANTRADAYAKNLNTGIKRPIAGATKLPPYQFVSSETVAQLTVYNEIAGVDTIRYELVVTNNTGGTIVLTNQTFEITVVLYRVPISS